MSLVALGCALQACAMPQATATAPAATAKAIVTPETDDEQGSAAGLTLRLGQGATGCTLAGPDGVAQPVPLPAGCRFHRDGAGNVRTMTKDGGVVFLVQTSRALAALPGDRPDCDTRVMAVMIKAGQLRPSPDVARVAACPAGLWDDVMFLGPRFPG